MARPERTETMANYDLIKLVFDLAFWMCLGTMGWIFLWEVASQIADAWRNSRLSDEEREQIAMWSHGSFSMRRSDSELRSRHVHKIQVTGRTAELNKQSVDPYAP